MIPTLTSVASSVPTTGKGISTKSILIILGLFGATYLVWKNKDKIKAFFGKKQVENK